MPPQIRASRRPPRPRRPLSRTAPTRRVATSGQRGWVWPTTSRRITGYPEQGHVAFDIGASQRGRTGEPIWAPTRSRVVQIRNEPNGYGLNVRLRAETGEEIILGHLAALGPALSVGQQLDPGELVGLMGSTGASTGPHLHFEINRPRSGAGDVFAPGWRSQSDALDPRTYYPQGYVGRPAFDRLPPISTFQFGETPPTPAAAPPTAQLGSLSVPVSSPSYQGAPTVPQGSVPPPVEAQGEDTVKIASTPLGDVSIPKPPLRKWIVFGFGAVLLFMGAGAIVSKGVVGTQKKVAELAMDIAPGVGEAKAIGKALKLVRK